MPKAFTRAISPRLSDCELTHLERQQIDIEQARSQHLAYEQVLEQSGLEVIRLPDLPTHPDGVFVEDTAVVLLRFRNGAPGTITVSDTATAPWNWDLSAGEAERFPRQDVNSHFLSGTDGSLTLPRLEFWHYREGKGWHDELTEERTALH